MKTKLLMLVTIFTIAACGKENPFDGECFQADSSAMACMRKDTGRFQFIHNEIIERGYFELNQDDDTIQFTRTYFNEPLFDLNFAKFKCSYRRDGNDLSLKCNRAGIFKDHAYFDIGITPDNKEIVFKHQNPNFSGDALK